MRKIINISALVYFVWLVLDAFSVPSALLNFIVVGVIPGVNIAIPPTVMLAIMSLLSGVIIFELVARRFGNFRSTR